MKIVNLFEQKMDLHVFLIERKKRIKDIAEIGSPRERLRRLDELEKWIESVRRPGWVIGHRLAAIERLRTKKEILFEQKGERDERQMAE